MSHYPYEVMNLSMHHKGGTKSYHVTTIADINNVTSNHGGYVLIKRWGKTGAAGQLSCECFATFRELNKAASDIVDSKIKGGYKPEGPRETIATDQRLLIAAVGRTIWPRISTAAINALDSTIDTSGRRDADVLEEIGDGMFGKRKINTWAPSEDDLRAEAEVAVQAARHAAEQKALQYKSVPNYGRF